MKVVDNSISHKISLNANVYLPLPSMLELPSPNRLTCIQLSDHILKHAFAGIFVYVVYLCFDFGFQFVYWVGLLRYTLFFEYAHKKKSGVVKSGLFAGHVPFDMIRSSKNSVRTSIIFLAV